MTSKFKTLMVLAALTSYAGVACAQEARAGRYTMHKSEDGFVRLDTETGQLALCRKADERWSCEDMAGTGPEQNGEVARLRRENEQLRAEIRRMEEDLGLHGGGGRGAAKRHSFKLPTEKEVDQALDYFERMLRKFQDRLQRLERKSEKPERQL